MGLLLFTLFTVLIAFATASTPPRKLIRGGNTIYKNKAWVVEIRDAGGPSLPAQQICTGTLIDEEFVVLAAHCWSFFVEPTTLYIRHYDNTNTENTIIRTVKSYRRHEDYKTVHGKFEINDIALIRLSEPVPRGVQKVQLQQYTTPVDLKVQAYGWGYTGKTVDGIPQLAQQLQHTQLRVVKRNYCSIKFELPPEEYFEMSHLCAQDITEESAICVADSGGPLVDESLNPPMLVGVASFGGPGGDNGCTPAFIPEVYSDVGYFYNWIMNTMVDLQ